MSLFGLYRTEKMIEVGFELFSKKNYLDAEKKFNEVLEKDPDNKDALFYLCQIYDNRFKYQELYDTSLKLLQIEPTNISVIGDHVRSLRKLYNDPQRELYFYELILTHKNNKKLEGSRGIAYYNCGYIDRAYNSLTKAIVLDKENNNYLNYLVTVCMKYGKLDEAIKYHKKSEERIMSGKYIVDSIFTDNDKILKTVK